MEVLKTEVVRPKGQPVYTVVEVRSLTNPNRTYRVDVVNQRCSCPSWKFSKGHRNVCKHLRELGFAPRATEPIKIEVMPELFPGASAETEIAL